MRIEELYRAQRATPFKPFSLRMADGREYRVPHPEFMLLHPDRRTVIVVHPEGGTDLLDLPLIASIHVGNGKATPRRRKAG